jgi:predicted nucleic acid-binding protein
MTALVDTGFLFALINNKDKHHQAVQQVLNEISDDFLLPNVVLVELSHLLLNRLGHGILRQTIQFLIRSDFDFAPQPAADLPRVRELLNQYRDNKLDFVDASIVTMAERLNITRILTVDQRDFRVIRPKHCDYFEVFP